MNKKTTKIIISLAVCFQFVRDDLDGWNPEDKEEKLLHKRLEAMVKAFDDVTLKILIEDKEDLKFWELCNEAEEKIGIINIGTAIVASRLLIKEDKSKSTERIKDFLSSISIDSQESNTKGGKLFAFLRHKVKVK